MSKFLKQGENTPQQSHRMNEIDIHNRRVAREKLEGIRKKKEIAKKMKKHEPPKSNA